MKKHRVDAFSLVFGVIFIAVLGWWFAGRSINVGVSVVGWTVAAMLIVIGGIGLLGALRGGRHREHGGDGTQPTDDNGA